MNLTFEEILSNFNSNYSYDNDFSKKQKKGTYILENSQFNLYDILVYLKKNGFIERIIEEIKSINKRFVFSSNNHGFNHNERVLFLGYIIGKERNFNDRNMRILLDACKYHDIGRVNGLRDDIHGLISANMISNVVKNDPFFNDVQNLNTLKCAIEFHSTLDRYLESMPENYNIDDKESAMEIMKVLKDAEGLDRVRTSMGRNYSDLDPKYLRTDEAKALIKLAHQLNELYLYHYKRGHSQNELDDFKKGFEGELYLHSVGFDFFKLESILKTGLLSKNEVLRRNILSSKNFDGCNFEDYISLACYGDEYYSHNNAYNNHVRGKIIFCIGDVEVVDGHKTSELTVNDYKNPSILLPVNMGEYADERFVKDEIPVEKIKNLIIPKNILELKLTDINYLSSSLSIGALESQIKYYISVVESKTNIPINKEELLSSLEMIRVVDDKSKRKEISAKNYQEEIFSFTRNMNDNIGIMINSMYQNIFQKEDVRIADVIDDIMIRNNLNVSRDDENYLYINLGETKKLH